MTLSERAKTYLRKLKRVSKWQKDSAATREYFLRQNLKVNETLVEIQEKFSGYELSIKNKPGHTFLLYLFSKIDIELNNKIELYYFGSNYLIDFGEHKTAPLNFYITDLGEICTLGTNEDDKPHIICSSVQKFIEQYALQNELTNQTESKYYYDIIDNEQLNRIIANSFSEIKECSDSYSQWYSNGQLTIVKGVLLDIAEVYLHVYGQNELVCNAFIESLKNAKIV